VLDVRTAAAFGTAHVPGSLNIGLNGQFAPWAGTLLAPDRGVVIVAEGDDEAAQAALRLARVGIEKVGGFLAGGIAAWEKAGLPLASLEHVTVDELHARLAEDPALQVVDVRRPGEFASGHVPRAVNLPLDRLGVDAPAIDRARPAAVVCAGGYRSSAAASLLQARGFEKLLNVVGGTAAWTGAGYPTES
jgi:rhodanese-related sulfurtransferase